MSSALKEFRTQREAAEQLLARVGEVSGLLRRAQEQADALAKHEAFRTTLREEERWLDKAEELVAEVRRSREREVRQFWPGVWKRWAVAVVFGLAACLAGGAGYVWASRPYAAELATLRERVAILDAVAQRILKMTPAERRQFDVLMKLDPDDRRH